MRKSIDTLSYLVEPLLAQKPASGNLFVFVGRDRTKVKCLYWDPEIFKLDVASTIGFQAAFCSCV
jgi:transposase